MIPVIGDERIKIVENEIIVLRFEIEIIDAKVEIERPVEIRLQAEFLRPLAVARPAEIHRKDRSEEHTSELQSLMRISYAVFCLKKKKKTYDKNQNMKDTKQTTHRTKPIQ